MERESFTLDCSPQHKLEAEILSMKDDGEKIPSKELLFADPNMQLAAHPYIHLPPLSAQKFHTVYTA